MVPSMITPPTPIQEHSFEPDVPVVAASPPILTPGAACVLLELVRQAARHLHLEPAGEDAA